MRRLLELVVSRLTPYLILSFYVLVEFEDFLNSLLCLTYARHVCATVLLLYYELLFELNFTLEWDYVIIALLRDLNPTWSRCIWMPFCLIRFYVAYAFSEVYRVLGCLEDGVVDGCI